MIRRLVFSPEAQTDVRALYLFVAERSGDARAIAYLNRIEAYCRSVADFPERGMPRDEAWPGLRVIGFERRVAIAFTVADEVVTILRILYGGRDLETAFTDDAD